MRHSPVKLSQLWIVTRSLDPMRLSERSILGVKLRKCGDVLCGMWCVMFHVVPCCSMVLLQLFICWKLTLRTSLLQHIVAIQHGSKGVLAYWEASAFEWKTWQQLSRRNGCHQDAIPSSVIPLLLNLSDCSVSETSDGFLLFVNMVQLSFWRKC